MASKPKITEKQIKCIAAIHRELHTDVPTEILRGETDSWTASQYIDRIKAAQSETPPGQTATGGRTPPKSAAGKLNVPKPTLGLASKLVFQSWSANGRHVLGNEEAFKKEVKQVLVLLNDVEQELAAEAAA
ncbi:MAG: hypothetical protein V2A73_00755 [Pseudomonadota bacterium]